MSKYEHLIDSETWAFINETNKWYPPNATTLSIAEQRNIYDRMCREFFAGYPEGVTANDSKIKHLPFRQYSGGSARAQVVYFHGGGFVVGGLDSHDDVCAEICDRTGFDVTSVDYRLAPEHSFPADFQDALDGFNHVAEHSEQPVVVVGDSAGGNLAAAVSHSARGGPFQPVGQVLIYPGLGSDFTGGSFIEHAEAPMLTTKETKFYKTIRTGGDESYFDDPRCMPLIDKDFTGLPPTVVISAECDPLSSDGQTYCNKISQAGGQAHWINETGLVHGFLRARHRVKRAKDSFTRIVDVISDLA